MTTPARSASFVFETGEVTIDVPDNWEVFRSLGTPMPHAVYTLDIKLAPPTGTKAKGTITIGDTDKDEPLTSEEFMKMFWSRAEYFSPQATEDELEVKFITVPNGELVYAILTDDSLVGETIPLDEYLYMALVLGNYNNGCITYSTLLFDDKQTTTFQDMLDAHISLTVTFHR